MMTRIYFVRHCEAEGNTKGILQGRSDFGISGNALKQLELISLRLRNVPFAGIYSSPLQRAYKTALSIDRYHHLGIKKEEGLVEIDMGRWENCPWESVKHSDPELVRIWDETPGSFEAPGGESICHVAERMKRTVSAIVKSNPDKTVCAVSHGCAIRSYLCTALGLPLERLNEVPWGDNTAVSVVEYENEKPHVVLVNDASHLPADLSVYRASRGAGNGIMGSTAS